MHRRTGARIPALPRALVAAVVVAACTDVVAPRPPSFSFSPNGITLTADNGALNQRERLFRKGFDPRNPHHGDAVIVNVYWLGSTNIVDSVTDVLNDANSTRVGNQYHFVDYVTAGGLSMATYVATNIRNFVDGDMDRILVVQAHLRDSVSDGGLKISAWSGVEDNFGVALGAVSSDTGSDTTITVARAGPIPVDAGALAYSVTMSTPVGVDPPGPPFQALGQGSDNFIKEWAAWTVPANATTVDPGWTWFFGPQRRHWLVTTLALRAAANPGNQAPTANFTSSCTGLACNFTSTSNDPDGTIASYSWTFGDGGTSTAQNPSHTYATGGTYAVGLTVTDNQGATNAISKNVTVAAANQPPVANFTFSCSGLSCSFTSTSNDPDGTIAGYSWTFGDGGTSTAQNPSHTYAAGGTYTVTLRVTDNQGAQSTTTSKTVTVTAPNQAPVVNAGPDETALTGLLYTLRWSFSDGNHNGPWTYTINWGDGSTSTGSVSSEGSFSRGHTYVTLLPRNFTITVTVRDASGASGSDTKVVTVLLL